MKTLFHKWRSIENLDDFIAEDELKNAAPDARYIVTEKLDGSNLQIAWDRETDTLSFFTRNGNSPFETTSVQNRFRQNHARKPVTHNM